MPVSSREGALGPSLPRPQLPTRVGRGLARHYLLWGDVRHSRGGGMQHARQRNAWGWMWRDIIQSLFISLASSHLEGGGCYSAKHLPYYSVV